MDLGLAGARVLVTAGASGIGAAITRAFLAEGAKVHICDIDRAALAMMESEGASTSHCDVSDRASVAALFADLKARLGGLDCLVNNAGIGGPTGRVDQISPEDWDRTLAVDITGQFNVTRLAVPLLMQSQNASICNISSAAGRFGFALRTPYAAAKWAVIGFTKSLAIELGPYHIRANAVLPGLVDGKRQQDVLTAKAAAAGISFDEMKRQAMAKASIPELISPQQIADQVVWLASTRARTTSGQAIGVDSDLQSLS